MSKVTMRRPDARAMAQLLAEQTQTAAGLILRLAWRQGLTREEIQRLTWNDVDFSAHQLRLPDRTIPLETETEDCLRRQAERPDPPTPFVVVSDRRRQQMPPESISRLARKTLDRAGLGGISLMDLRHDFIIRHLESHDWPYVARISGIAVPTLYAVFSDYLPEGRQKDSRPRREVDGFLMWKLLQAEGSSPVGLALWMGWKLGMQVREMTALTWDQVDLDRGLVRLPDRDLALGVTLRRLLRAAAGRRRPGEDPHVLLTPNSRRPLDQPRLSKMVRTALIRGGMEHISLGDLCREERRENEDARLLEAAQRLDADVVQGGWQYLYTDGTRGPVQRYPAAVYTGAAAPERFELPGMPWGKVYRRELFAQVRFPAYYTCFEDAIIHFLVFRLAKTVASVPEMVYLWRKNPKGLTATSQHRPAAVQSYWIMEQLLAQGPFYDLPDRLVDAANENGGSDNITALLLAVEPTEVHHG